MISRSEDVSHYREESFFYLGISIDRRDKGVLWIEWFHFLIFLDRIGNIGSLDFSLSFDICRMDDIYYGYFLISIGFYDFLRMILCIWSTRLSRKEDSDRLSIDIVIREDS